MYQNIIIIISLVALAAGYTTVQQASESDDDRIATEFPDLSNDCNNVTKTNTNERYESLENFVNESISSGVPISEQIKEIEKLTTDDLMMKEKAITSKNFHIPYFYQSLRIPSYLPTIPKTICIKKLVSTDLEKLP